MKLDGPIPGQSLTTEPGNSPWEQPPLYASTEEALAFHLKKLNKPKHQEKLMFLLEQGFPIDSFVNSVTSYAVMNGFHNIDVSTLISPVLHEYVKGIADSGGIKYKEWDGPTDEDKEAEEFKNRLSVMLPKALNTKVEPEAPAPTPEATQEMRSGGLISRRTK